MLQGHIAQLQVAKRVTKTPLDESYLLRFDFGRDCDLLPDTNFDVFILELRTPLAERICIKLHMQHTVRLP